MKGDMLLSNIAYIWTESVLFRDEMDLLSLVRPFRVVSPYVEGHVHKEASRKLPSLECQISLEHRRHTKNLAKGFRKLTSFNWVLTY